MHALLRFRLSVALVAFGLLTAMPARAQNRPLFSDERDAPAAARASVAISDPAVIRSRQVTVDLSLLAQGGISTGGLAAIRPAAQTVDLNLFADADLVAQLDRVETVSTLGYAWVGTVAGVEGSQVILAMADGVLTGAVILPTQMFSVRQANGGYQIMEINRALLPGDEVVHVPAGAAASAPLTAVGAGADTGDVFDLLLYYTTGVKNTIGSNAAVNSFITAAIAQVNAAYAASNIGTRVRLAAALESGYVDSGDACTDDNALRVSTTVQAARDQYGADIVSMLVTHDPTASGCGYVSVSKGVPYSQYAFNATVYYKSVSYIYALAHEMGHNQGSLHEPGNNDGDDASGAFPYSLGYTDVTHRFFDIMSYGCKDCTQLNQFSSPNNSYQGSPTGTAGQDNVRSINNTRVTIANYRPSGGAPPLATPTGMTATSSGSTVTLSWAAPITGTASSYIVEAGSASGLADLANFNTGNTRTSYATSGVGNGTFYVRARATDGTTTTAASNEATLVVGSGCSAPPSAPANFTGVSNGGGVVTFTWTASTGASSYVIEAGLSAGSKTLVPGSDVGAATAYSAAGVGAGTYFVRMRAKNLCGTSTGTSNEVALIVK